MWHDVPLDPSVETIYLDPEDFSGVATVQFVAHVPTLLAVNASGQTYGASGTSQGEPDFILVAATNGRTGYVYRDAREAASGATAAGEPRGCGPTGVLAAPTCPQRDCQGSGAGSAQP